MNPDKYPTSRETEIMYFYIITLELPGGKKLTGRGELDSYQCEEFTHLSRPIDPRPQPNVVF